MSAGSLLLTEEQLLCCICLDVFTNPVTLPCGHNFCKSCITQHMNFNSHRQCPLCKERIDKKHKLVVNTFISEMAVQFRQSAGKDASSSSEQHEETNPGKVSNDVPIGLKRKSRLLLAMSLTFLTIYLATNLKLHQIVSNLNFHQLFDAIEMTADSMCTEHDKPLELYCKNEQMSVCRACADSSHRFHHVVSLKEEFEVKKAELRKTEAKLQQMIQERRLKVQEVEHSVKLSRETADRETADGLQVFAALTQSVEQAKAEFIRTIEEKKRAKEEQAKDVIRELEQEISELTRRRAEVDRLSCYEDHLHFLRKSSTLNAAPPTNDRTEISTCPASYAGIIRTAVLSAVNQLTETVTQEMKKLQEDELRQVQRNTADVALDPDTAHPALVLSDDGKQVRHGDVWKKLPENSKRFETAISVLGKRGFSCRRFHYDVQVKGNIGWTLGVAKQSVNRKGEITLNPENGYWTLCRRNRNGYFALDDQPVPLSVNDHPEKVRVFVDYKEGLVSFYDVDTAALLYSFTGCSFTEKLLPFFSPGRSDGGRNSAPLIISPVDQSVL
ncbi:E3 ubiquitin-protein ligase TRIM39-like [Seriola dumerili]|uniref:E3 ubiquitin-protein ligase TRIM39-like n=1 Tax=Seriola dumerili TaxID=41447 RepID=UPI000BBECB86|nr:E3 ubiquitin-protein ligase TRIM39-like [Seriola dumerili]